MGSCHPGTYRYATNSPKTLYHLPLSREKNNNMATNAIPTPHEPTDTEALALFTAIEEKFPSTTLGNDTWYILLVSNVAQAQAQAQAQ